MMRAWFGVALLAVSWLLGTHYYCPASWPAWTLVIALGTMFLAHQPGRPLSRGQVGIALVMLLPAVWLLPWPR